MPLLHTEAVTLRRRRTREADALLVLFCKESGKITASTRSVLKTTSRYAGVTQPFNHIDTILYAKVEDQEIWTLTQTALIRSFDHLRDDVTRMTYASCLAEWVDFLSGDLESSRPVWSLILQAFQRWNDQTPVLEDLFYYQWQLLMDAGLYPEISRCRSCSKTDSPAWHYEPSAGGLACPDCSPEGHTIHHGSIQALRRMAASPEPPLIRLSPAQIDEINLLLQTHLEYHIGVRSRASLFLSQWNNTLKTQLLR